ncbi:MAG: hypothetical protein JWR68_857 [Polaromonas sp.]|nr:hypothetical protein [Polaromonas sp.]
MLLDPKGLPAVDQVKTTAAPSQAVAQPSPSLTAPLASCSLQPLTTVAGEKDGRFPLQSEVDGLTAADAASFIVVGKEAAAAGRTRDAEVAFLMSCRVAQKLKGADSVESASAKYQLGWHYAKVALEGNAAGASRAEMLKRAEGLYSDSLQTYRTQYGESHEKSRFAAEGLAAVRQRLAQASNTPSVPGPDTPAQGKGGMAGGPVKSAGGAGSPPERALVAKTQPRQTETAQALPSSATPSPSAATRRPQPSFDCRRARSVSEKLICSDDELARLDRELGQVYARARNAAPNRAAFRRQQEEEWRRREATCQDRDCLLRWYAQRHDQLTNDLSKGAEPTQASTRAPAPAAPAPDPEPATASRRVFIY